MVTVTCTYICRQLRRSNNFHDRRGYVIPVIYLTILLVLSSVRNLHLHRLAFLGSFATPPTFLLSFCPSNYHFPTGFLPVDFDWEYMFLSAFAWNSITTSWNCRRHVSEILTFHLPYVYIHKKNICIRIDSQVQEHFIFRWVVWKIVVKKILATQKILFVLSVTIFIIEIDGYCII